jgi:hypothetical protein
MCCDILNFSLFVGYFVKTVNKILGETPAPIAL